MADSTTRHIQVVLLGVTDHTIGWTNAFMSSWSFTIINNSH